MSADQRKLAIKSPPASTKFVSIGVHSWFAPPSPFFFSSGRAVEI
jgi:hypothetical protein